MRKATVIATCLVNMQQGFRELAQAELAVRNIFADCFPTADFDDWNREMSDRAAADKIREFGKASRIKVDQFILDLWQ